MSIKLNCDMGESFGIWKMGLDEEITIIILVFALLRTVLFTYDSYAMEMVSESVSVTPLYLTQLVMLLGLTLFILVVLVFILKGLKWY